MSYMEDTPVVQKKLPRDPDEFGRLAEMDAHFARIVKEGKWEREAPLACGCRRDSSFFCEQHARR